MFFLINHASFSSWNRDSRYAQVRHQGRQPFRLHGRQSWDASSTAADKWVLKIPSSVKRQSMPKRKQKKQEEHHHREHPLSQSWHGPAHPQRFHQEFWGPEKRHILQQRKNQIGSSSISTRIKFTQVTRFPGERLQATLLSLSEWLQTQVLLWKSN